MNKPAGQGTVLPWHQDGGDVWALDRDPLVTIWVALDPATRANGCVEVVPGHAPAGPAEPVRQHASRRRTSAPLPRRSASSRSRSRPGHAVLLHNWLIHRSGVNPSPVPRRAFTACYMDGRTQSILTGNHFPLVAGSLPAELPVRATNCARTTRCCVRPRLMPKRTLAAWKRRGSGCARYRGPRGGSLRVRARLAAATR